MKTPRNVMRKVESKIYQAVTLEQMRKNSLTETQQKISIDRSNDSGSSSK